MALTPVHEALSQILADVASFNRTSIVDLSELCGRTLAQDISASIDVPPWDNSAMDGYALYVGDDAAQLKFRISQTVYAGDYPDPLLTTTCARIYTGAPIPAGANAVVMQENVTVEGDYIQLKQAAKTNDNVRLQGQDIKAGQLLYSCGHVFKAADLSVLAAVGINSAVVFDKPRIALISTGDELAEPGTELEPGQIYNSNQILLKTLLTNNACDVIQSHVVADSLTDTINTLSAVADNTDLIISSGGVSVGGADYLKQALAEVGKVHLWKMAIKPGKPLVYGRVANTPYFGLPGNPSSAFVTLMIAVFPYISRMLLQPVSDQKYYAKTDFNWPKAGSRQEYLRVQVYSDGVEQRVRLFANQSSGIVLSVAWANALAIVPVDTVFDENTVIEILPLPGG